MEQHEEMTLTTTSNAGALQETAMVFFNEQTEKNFSPLYKRLHPGLTQYAYTYVRDEEAANDIVQASFVKVWTKINQYNPYWNFSTWVYRIVFNECMQHIRKSKAVMPLFENYDFTEFVGFEAEEPDWALEKDEDQHEVLYKAVVDSIHGLPEGLYKNIMVDREIHGLKYHEISEKYGININSVKTRISRARDMVQKAASKRMETPLAWPSPQGLHKTDAEVARERTTIVANV